MTIDETIGTFLNLDASDAGDWFIFFGSSINETGVTVYDDPLPSAGRVCVRSMTEKVKELLAIRKKKSEFVLNPESRSMERVTYFDDEDSAQTEKYSADIWDYVIVSWENLKTAKGEDIACTRENKIKLMRVPIFNRFIARCLQLIQSSGIVAAENAEKNLLPG